MPFGPAAKYFQLRKVLRDQWLPSDKLKQIQTARLRRVIKHAYQNVPYYHNLFKLAGVTPEEIKESDGNSAQKYSISLREGAIEQKLFASLRNHIRKL